MRKGELHTNVLDVVQDGIYINIYQKKIQVIDENISKAASKMISLEDLLRQLKGINEAYPRLICTTYTIDLIKPNYDAGIGGPYRHQYRGISNEYVELYDGVSNLEKIIEGVEFTIEHINDKKALDSMYWLVQGCNILCINKKQKMKNSTRKSISKSIRHEVFKRDGFKCVECGATKEDTRLHIDHILPVSQGGSDEMDNLQTLCESCNLSKSNRKWTGGCLE